MLTTFRFVLPLAALVLVRPAWAQDEALRTPSVAPDAMARARAAARGSDPAEALSRYLRVLASRPDDVPALTGAGQAALGVGDVNAAAGFFGRADARDPRNGAVKTGLAETALQQGDARGALRLFRDAVDLGVAPASIAADRGIAYDLRGDPHRAQADYQLALRASPDDEVTRRLAVSQAISGDRAAALATLDPLLRRQDVPAWRMRVFVFALTGDTADAMTAAALVMPRDQVAALTPYLPRLAALRPGDKAAAVHLGRFPGENSGTAGGSIAIASAASPSRATGSSMPPAPTDEPTTIDPFVPRAPLAPITATSAETRARQRALVDALAAARARAAAHPPRAPTDTPVTRLVVAAPAPTIATTPPAAASEAPAVAAAPAPAAPSLSQAVAMPKGVTPPARITIASLPSQGSAPSRPATAIGTIALAPPPSHVATAPQALSSAARIAGAAPPSQVAVAEPDLVTPPAPIAATPPPQRLAATAPPAPPSARTRTVSVAPAVPPAPTRAERLAQEKARRAEAVVKKKAAEERAAAEEQRQAERRNPARHWVQVAGGANKADLGKAWDALRKKWPRQLAGRSPWTLHYRYTNRLLIGPFASSDAAQDWVSDRRGEGLSTFRVETNAGDPVERVPTD